MKTFQPKVKEMKRSWHLIDADGKVLGRIATEIAKYLIGKHKATYSANLDSGDFVVVVNAEKVLVTGKKSSQKAYRRHSGYPHGFKERSYEQVMDTFPERIIEHAVSGMVPDNRLKKIRMGRLKVVAGSKNPFGKMFEKTEEKGAPSK